MGSYLKSFMFIVMFLGVKNNNTIIKINSLIIFISTTPVTANTKESFISFGIIIIVRINLIICSITFDNVAGNISSFPKKYPFKMDEIQIKGRVKPIAISG